VTLTPQEPHYHRWKGPLLGKVHHQDIAAAVHFGLSNGVFLEAKKPLKGDKLATMKTWLHTLHKLLPQDGTTLGTLVDFIDKKTSVKQDEFEAVSQKVTVIGFKNDTKPLGCKGFAH